MSKILPINRVVLILHAAFVVLTAVGIFLATTSHSLPAKWQNTVAAAGTIIAALAAATVAVTKFLDGSQKSEALAAAPAVSEHLDATAWLEARTPQQGLGGGLVQQNAPVVDPALTPRPAPAPAAQPAPTPDPTAQQQGFVQQ